MSARVIRRVLLIRLVLVGLSGLLSEYSTVAASQGRVLILRIEGEIELGLRAYASRVLKSARGQEAQAVIIVVKTQGGRLDAALDIKDYVLDSPVRTIAFVNRQAYSAGALITIAAKEIFVASGAVIGAATPVIGDTGEVAGEKTVSAWAHLYLNVREPANNVTTPLAASGYGV